MTIQELITQNDADPPPGSGCEPVPTIVVIGKTGAGKSSFIDTLGGRDLYGKPPVVDGGIESCTVIPTAYIITHLKRKVILLDTPGFDDSGKDNLSILNEIAGYLYTISLHSNVAIRGVIFMHDISETRMAGSQRKTWEILKTLCGPEAMGNVLVGTTMWSSGTPKKYENEVEREKQMLVNHWQGIFKTMRVLEDDAMCAGKIIDEMLSLPAVQLLVQKEMMTPPHTVENTTAGQVAFPEGRAEKERLERELEEQKRIDEQRERERQAELARLEAERIKREEEHRRQLEEERRRQEEERRRKEEEFRRKAEEENRRREEERRRREEEQRRRFEEERRRQEAERRRREEEEQRRREEERRRAEEERRRIMEEMRRQEEAQRRQMEEERRRHEEHMRRLEEERRAEEHRRWQESQRHQDPDCTIL